MKDTQRAALWQRIRIPLLIYLVCLGGYLAASGNRLRGPSSDNHYVYLARCLLQGRLSLAGAPPHLNDWAQVVELTLADGRTVRGSYLQTRASRIFKTTTGERLEISPGQIRSRKDVYYVSFPWFPALLMMPFVAIWGLRFNDVIFNCAFGALNPVLVFFVLRRLATLKLSPRRLSEDLWLVGMFAFGTVHFYSSVIGQVWYTAHVVGVALTAAYALAALGGRHPLWAGLFLGLGFVTRTPIPFSIALLVGEVLRRHLREPPADAPPPDPCHRPPLLTWLRELWPRINWKPSLSALLLALIPMGAVAGVAMVVNAIRFNSPFEFGHYYLNVRWTERIQRWGLFNAQFISRNLAALLTLGPKLSAEPPYVQISYHGLSLFLTTPLFLFLIWPRRRCPVQPWLYLAVLPPLLLHLLYQNSGWVQFGARFSLDYTVFLVALLAVGGYRLGAFAKSLILFGVAVNTFGALTYHRYWQFYWDGMFPIP